MSAWNSEVKRSRHGVTHRFTPPRRRWTGGVSPPAQAPPPAAERAAGWAARLSVSSPKCSRTVLLSLLHAWCDWEQWIIWQARFPSADTDPQIWIGWFYFTTFEPAVEISQGIGSSQRFQHWAAFRGKKRVSNLMLLAAWSPCCSVSDSELTLQVAFPCVVQRRNQISILTEIPERRRESLSVWDMHHVDLQLTGDQEKTSVILLDNRGLCDERLDSWGSPERCVSVSKLAPFPRGSSHDEEEAVCRKDWGHQMDASDGATFAAGQEFTVSLN